MFFFFYKLFANLGAEIKKVHFDEPVHKYKIGNDSLTLSSGALAEMMNFKLFLVDKCFFPSLIFFFKNRI